MEDAHIRPIHFRRMFSCSRRCTAFLRTWVTHAADIKYIVDIYDLKLYLEIPAFAEPGLKAVQSIKQETLRSMFLPAMRWKTGLQTGNIKTRQT